MRKDQHTIFGINGCTAVLESKKYKIIDIIIQAKSPAERDPRITHILGHYGGHLKSSIQINLNLNLINGVLKVLLYVFWAKLMLQCHLF